MFSVSNAEIKYERAGFYRNLRIGGGNLDVDIVYEEQDEIGDMAAGMKQVVTKLQGIIANLDEKLGKLADGDVSFENNENDLYVGAFKLKSDTE